MAHAINHTVNALNAAAIIYNEVNDRTEDAYI